MCMMDAMFTYYSRCFWPFAVITRLVLMLNLCGRPDPSGKSCHQLRDRRLGTGSPHEDVDLATARFHPLLNPCYHYCSLTAPLLVV